MSPPVSEIRTGVFFVVFFLFMDAVEFEWKLRAPVWGSAANTNIQKVQTPQNKLLRSTCKFPWYIHNQTIHNILKVESVRKVIKNFSQNFYNSIPTIPNPELFNLPDEWSSPIL